MAERRMFSKSIVQSDAFLDMPLSSQALYFQLGMEADDDGFVNSPKRTQKLINANEDDLKLLLAKSFLIDMGDGIVVIKHWKMNNYIQKDRYRSTVYRDKIKLLYTKENGGYTLDKTQCIQSVSNLDTQVSIGKVSIGEVSIGKDIKEDCKLEDSSPTDFNSLIKEKYNDKYSKYRKQMDELRNKGIKVLEDGTTIIGDELPD